MKNCPIIYLGWIEFQTNELSQSNCSNLDADEFEAQNDEGLNILDPKLTKAKVHRKKCAKKSNGDEF